MEDTLRQLLTTTVWPPITGPTSTAATVVNNLTTTMKPGECDPSDIVWIKIALLLAILFAQRSEYLIDTNVTRASPLVASQPLYPIRQSAPQAANGQSDNILAVPNAYTPTANTLTGFKRLSVTQETPRAPLSSSLQSPNTSSFSINMAPPSPRSLTLGMGMDSPEETVVKKLALDKIEQEEAKRHNDLALMAEKSTSMSPLKEQLKLEPDEERKPERKLSDPLPQSKKKKKRRSAIKASKGSKGSEPSAQALPTSHKNPSFTLDNKTNKLLLGSSIKNSDATASPDKKFSV